VWRPLLRLPPALLAAALGFGWQGLTLHYSYGGNFTAFPE
jgi:hypothetical protein